MKLRNLLIVLASLYIGINIVLMMMYFYGSYNHEAESYREITEKYLESSFESYRSELIGNLILGDQELLDAFLKDWENSKNIGIRIVSDRTYDQGFYNRRKGQAQSFTVDVPGSSVANVSLVFESKDKNSLLFSELIGSVALQALLIGLCLIFIYSILKSRILVPIEKLSQVAVSGDVMRDHPEKASEEILQLYKSFKKMHLRVSESAKAEGIARTTQMFAHDVRTPFSMLTGILQSLRSASSKAEMDAIVSKHSGGVEHAMDRVNCMIADVLEVGSQSELCLESFCMRKAVKLAIQGKLRLDPKAGVHFEYDFQHTHLLQVDGNRFVRVLENIIGNALQAVERSGKLSFRSFEVNDKVGQHSSSIRERLMGTGFKGDYHSLNKNFIVLEIHNSGSYIDDGECDQIFESFFTKNKPLGTGLGLAISKKIVLEHKGKVWVQSDKLTGTSFFVLMPLTDKIIDNNIIDLPSNSGGLADEKGKKIINFSGSEAAEIDGLSRSILVVDDEVLNFDVVKSEVKNLGYLATNTLFTYARNFADAMYSTEENEFDYIIIDFDLGEGIDSEKNGLYLAQKIIDQGITAKICLHSNHKRSEIKGLNLLSSRVSFIPKPMTSGALRDFLHQDDVDPALRPSVVVIDDNLFVRESWQTNEGVEVVEKYACPEEALKNITDYLSVDAIVLDYNFLPSAKMNGLQLAKCLRMKDYKGYIFLASNGEFDSKELVGDRITKSTKNPSEIINILNQKRA